MLSQEDLEKLIVERLSEAQILHDAGKYGGAIYLCGYTVELGLKYIILRDQLCGFPEDDDEFKLYEKVKTHNLQKLFDILDKKELKDNKTFWSAWGEVLKWKPGIRYSRIDEVTEESSSGMLDSARAILKQLGVSI